MIVTCVDNVSATVNHSLAFSAAYEIARNAFSDDSEAGENYINSYYYCLCVVCCYKTENTH